MSALLFLDVNSLINYNNVAKLVLTYTINMILKIFLERFFVKMAYWLYSFKNYFRVIAISQPKSTTSESTPCSTVSKTPNAKGSLSARGDGFTNASGQYGVSKSDKDVLGYVSNSDILNIIFIYQLHRSTFISYSKSYFSATFGMIGWLKR